MKSKKIKKKTKITNKTLIVDAPTISDKKQEQKQWHKLCKILSYNLKP